MKNIDPQSRFEKHNRRTGSLTRRGFLGGIGMVVAGVSAGQEQARSSWEQGGSGGARDNGERPKTKLGLATMGFADLTHEEMAELAREAGVDCVQLFFSQKDTPYWRYNGRFDASPLTPEACRRIAESYRSRALEIHSLGVYTSLIEPDEGEREQNLRHFIDMMRIAQMMGIGVLVTECGTALRPGIGRDLNIALHEEAYPRLMDSVRKLLPMAEERDIIIAFEGYFQDLLASATAIRYFIEEINHPRVRVLLDPANLLPHNTLEEMFAALGPYIVALHAKDRKLHVTHGVAAGEGDLDYRKFIALARQHCPQAPLILEYVNTQSYRSALAHVRSFL